MLQLSMHKIIDSNSMTERKVKYQKERLIDKICIKSHRNYCKKNDTKIWGFHIYVCTCCKDNFPALQIYTDTPESSHSREQALMKAIWNDMRLANKSKWAAFPEAALESKGDQQDSIEKWKLILLDRQTNYFKNLALMIILGSDIYLQDAFKTAANWIK